VQPASQQIPVLTGMPVSGMAYLDRPSEAGYFIFPDLSVRHEGKYRLSFNLYEETKDAKDSDVEQSSEGQSKSPPTAATPNGSFDWRLEVKSAPFTVYSAKKFPGLTESTILSRTVAEQGCRVRIRRDVRMRRRDGKSGGDFDEFDEEYSRSRRTATPDSVHDAYARQRSLSNSSVDRQPYVPDSQRRPPGADYPQQPYSSNYAPSPITPQSGSSGYLSFGGSSAQQYQAPQFPQPTPTSQPMQNQPPYQSAQSSYNPPPPPPSNYRQSSTSANYAYPDRQPYPHQYAPQRENYDGEYRRPPAAYPPTSAPSGNQYPAVDQNYPRSGPLPSYQQYPPRAHTPVGQSPVSLAPLKMPPIEPKYDNLSSSAGPLAGASRMAPPLPSPSFQERPNSFNHYPTSSSTQPAPEPPRSSKRPFDSVFSTSSFTQPLHNGMRPTSSHRAQGSTNTLDDDDDNSSMEALRMQYKRADGTSYSRELPAFE
jgi:Velvet factor